MSSNDLHWLPRTLCCRLTLWFAGLFAALSLLAFATVDIALRSSLEMRLDERLMGTAREYEALHREYGTVALDDEFRREADAAGAENLLLTLRAPDGKLLASPDAATWQDLDRSGLSATRLVAGEAGFRTLHVAALGADFRVVEARTADGNLLQVGESLAGDQALVRRCRMVFGALLGAMLAIGVGLAWRLTRRAMAGVERVTLAAVVRDAVELFQPVADSRALVLEATVPAAAVVIDGSLPRLQRVVANLLDNALKYTPAGGQVHVSLSGGDATATLCVADTGIGIPAEQRQRIFDRFFRGDASRSTPGNGLGLPLARAFVRAHGGEISVESTPGQGSTFTVWLPRPSQTAPQPIGDSP